MAVNNNTLTTKAQDNMFSCAQMQRMSHYYNVIVCHAYCMDAEYAIKPLLVKSVKIVEIIVPKGKISQF